MTFVVEKSGRIDHETEVPKICSERSGAFETRLVQKVDGRRRIAAECDYMLELAGSLDGLDQCRADAAAGPEDNRYAWLGKRSKINAVTSRLWRFEALHH